jgi:cyclic beta-1,2-glucan synthetase
MHRAGIESILGLRRHGETLAIEPCIPQAWPGFELTWRFEGTLYAIEVANPLHRSRGVAEATLDGRPVDALAIPLADDGRRHEVKVVLGEPAAAVAAAVAAPAASGAESA